MLHVRCMIKFLKDTFIKDHVVIMWKDSLKSRKDPQKDGKDSLPNISIFFFLAGPQLQEQNVDECIKVDH